MGNRLDNHSKRIIRNRTRQMAEARGINFAATTSGKIKMLLQSFCIGTVMVKWAYVSRTWGDIFNLSTQLGQNGIIDHKIDILLLVLRKFNGFKYLAIGFIHKRSPTVVCILFESIQAILLGRRPLQPMLLAKAMNGFHL